MTSEIFREKQEINKNKHHVYDDKTIENMKQYFKIEHDSDALLRYIRGNRINHDVLTLRSSYFFLIHRNNHRSSDYV